MTESDGFLEEWIETADCAPQDSERPSLIISEQPAASVRFRYPSEGKCHGVIPGARSNEFRKSCPTVEITGYKGYAKIVIQLVTDDPDPKTHVYSLVGKQCDNGICTVTCGPGEMRYQFPYLGIQQVKKKRAEEILYGRFKEQYQATLSDKELRNQAKAEVERMNLSAVRLMFVAYLPDQNNEFTNMLPPVISTPIVDNKSTLKICRISRVDSPSTGGTEVFLLCDKVQKDDIQVRMFERDESQNEIWEDFCHFSPMDVHRQYAIVFKTPAYRNRDIDQSTRVFIQLLRKSDGQSSPPLQFTYTPVIEDLPVKRKRTICGPPSNQSLTTTMAPLQLAPDRPWNLKPKVDIHMKPIDPSLLMQRSNITRRQRDQASYLPPLPQNPQWEPQWLVSYDSMAQGTVVAHNMVDRQGLGSDRANILDQLDFDDGNGDIPSIDSEFVENFLNETSIPLRTMRLLPAFEDDETAEETQPEEHSINDTFTKKLLESMLREIKKLLRDKSGNAEAMRSAKQFFTKVHNSTCLHLAVLHGHTDILLKFAHYATMVEPSGSLLNVYNDAQQTPLHICILKGDVKIVESLLHSGSDPSVVDGNGNTGLHLACEMGRADIVALLLSAKGYGEEMYNYKGLTPLHILAQSKSDKSVECLKALLLRESLDINERELKSGQTALHMSVEKDNTMFTTFLVNKGGADIDAMTFDGLTPLHIASARGNSALVQLLLALGADRDTCISEESGSSALSVAANEEIRRILLQPDDAMSPDKEEANQLVDSGLEIFV